MRTSWMWEMYGMQKTKRPEVNLMGLQMEQMKANTKLTNAQAENEMMGKKDNLEKEGLVLDEQVDKLKKEIGRVEAERVLKVTENEIKKLEKEILEVDKNFLKDNNLSREEWGIIKAGKQVYGSIKDFLKWNEGGITLKYNEETGTWDKVGYWDKEKQ